MKTQLDDSDYWFLHGIAYQDNELVIYLAEGFESDPEPVNIVCETVDGVRNVDVSDKSRLFRVRFQRIGAWQVVDESFTQRDDYEISDDENHLKCISRSKYLDYVLSNHGWFEETLGPALQYRVWTLTDVVDVISCEPPEIEAW